MPPGPQGYDRYAYVNNNPVIYTDPSGNDAVGEFIAGFTQEAFKNVLWFHPQAQEALATKQSESAASLAGRVVADVASIIVGSIAMDTGAGAVGAGLVSSPACATGVGCLVSVGAIAGGVALAAEGAGVGIGGALGLGQNAMMFANKLKENQEKGRRGEELAGITDSKSRIPSRTGTAKYRVPDGLDDTSLTEVKNKGYQSLTSQLKDFLQYAQETGRNFILKTPGSTTFSSPLKKLIDTGKIIWSKFR